MNRLFSLIFVTSLLNAISAFAQPSFTAGSDITINQDSGPFGPALWATNIVATTPSFEIISINYSGFLTLDSIAPNTLIAIDATGNITFQPTQSRSGSATVTVALRDDNTGLLSIPATFRIIVNFINAAPTFNLPSPNLIIDEKAGVQTILGWATDISPGPNPEEITQDISFSTNVLSQSGFMSFTQLPKVDKTGTLIYEVSDKANGTATIEVFLEDDGSNFTPNSNISTPKTLTITVNPINDPPSFNVGDNIHIDEHNGLVTILNWANDVSAGAPDEDVNQIISFVVTAKSTTAFLEFDIPVGVDASGTLSFQAKPHYNGVAVYEIYLSDDGPATPPNDNTSALQGFTVSVDFINDAPSFNIGTDIVIDEGNSTGIFPDWATNVIPGESPNEQEQELLFTVVFQQVTGSLAFLRSPEIDETGQLLFRPTEHTHGEAIFDVYLTDDGDFEAPNENVSPKQSFKVTVNKVNYPPDDLFLSNTIVKEKQDIGSFVGTLSTVDLDPEDTHNYALVPGEGSDDNASFVLDGTNILTNEVFDWLTKKSYTLRIKTSDGEFSLEKSFGITIEKVIEGIKFANAITPNDDGENDTWELEDIEAFPDVTVFIYDNSGQNVYKSKQGYEPWDGRFNGRNLPMGTYYYVIDLHDGKNVYKGSLTIIL